MVGHAVGRESPFPKPRRKCVRDIGEGHVDAAHLGAEQLAHLTAHDDLALLQDHHAIAERLDVAQDVRREEDRLTLAFSRPR